MKRSDFRINHTHDGWRLTNVRDDGDRHAHFFNKNGAKITMRLTLLGILASHEYFREAQKRLLPEKDFKKLIKEEDKRKKQRYINVQRHSGGGVGGGNVH